MLSATAADNLERFTLRSARFAQNVSNNRVHAALAAARMIPSFDSSSLHIRFNPLLPTLQIHSEILFGRGL